MTPKESKFLIVEGKRIHYDVLHRDLRKKYGNATNCNFCNTEKAKRYEWALLKDRSYSMDINDYIPLCPSCHRKYDITKETRLKMSKSRKGLYLNGNNASARKVINNESGEIFDTVKQAAEFVSLKRTTLIMMLNGSNKNKTKLSYYEQR